MLSIVVALVGAGAGVASASAEPLEAPPSGSVAQSELWIDHYDLNVAAANGFEIRAADDGSQYPVPVTPEAQVIADEYPLVYDILVTPYGYSERVGNCGMSYIAAYRYGDGQHVDINTGFSVSAPVTSRSWSVQLAGLAGIRHFPLSGGASPATWGTSKNYIEYSSGGSAHVTVGSYVMLTTGAICYAYEPTTTF